MFKLIFGIQKYINLLRMKISKRYCERFIRIKRYDESFHSIFLREQAYKRCLKSCGEDIRIKTGVFLKNPDEILLGNRISIQENCLLSGYGGLRLGNDISIGAGTMIFTSEHDYQPKGIIRSNPILKKDVTLEDNIWIGAKVTILGGVKIGKNSVIGANSLVNKDVEPNSVYVGNPARKIKEIL